MGGLGGLLMCVAAVARVFSSSTSCAQQQVLLVVLLAAAAAASVRLRRSLQRAHCIITRRIHQSRYLLSTVVQAISHGDACR